MQFDFHPPSSKKPPPPNINHYSRKQIKLLWLQRPPASLKSKYLFQARSPQPQSTSMAQDPTLDHQITSLHQITQSLQGNMVVDRVIKLQRIYPNPIQPVFKSRDKPVAFHCLSLCNNPCFSAYNCSIPTCLNFQYQLSIFIFIAHFYPLSYPSYVQ